MQWNWLHLSDLHCGMRMFDSLWPRVEKLLFDDLATLHERAGPWDLVLLTGDLVQRGQVQEFQQLDQFLARLFVCLERLGSRPFLLAVPGNHDLVRPEALELGELAHWAAKKRIPEEFWCEASSPQRALLNKAFANYQSWWEACAHRPAKVRAGWLPGDIAYSAEKHGFHLGIAGLNSTFLQLADGNYKGRLGLHVKQFNALSDRHSGPAWAGEHHVCLLLSHQPPDWLMPDAALHLRGEIATSDHFAAHLFGHMHEARYVSMEEGGSGARHFAQAKSLFGLETFSHGLRKLERSHGYSAGRLRIKNEQVAELTFWPREARRGQDGALRFAPDTTYKLDDYGRTTVNEVPLLKPAPAARALTEPLLTTAAVAGPSYTKLHLEDGKAGNLTIRTGAEPVDVKAIKMELADISIDKH